MIEVDLPDGSVAEFPDGTPPDVMKQALQKRFGAPQQTQQPQSPQLQAGLAELSAATQNPARAQYDALPEWQKPLVAASDTVQLAANGATFGFGDKLAAGMRAPFTDKSYEEELAAQRGLTQGARNRAGSAGVAAEIAGGVAAPMALANKGLTLAGRGGTAAMTGAKGLGARTALMGAEGASYGALSAVGNDQDIGTGALVGGLAGVGGNLLGEGIAKGVDKFAGRFNPKAPQLTVDDLKAASSAAYKKADAAGVMFNQQGVNQLRANIIEDLTARGFDPINEPGVMPVIKRLEEIGKGNVTLKGLDTLRKVAANGYRPGLKSNNAAVGEIINRIDDFVANAPFDASGVGVTAGAMSGDPKAAAAALKEARSMWGRARKLETVETLINKGELIGGSQKNQDVAGATRRQLRGILMNESKARGFSPAELDATRKAVMGTGTKRALDAVGGLFPRDRLSTAVQGMGTLATGGAYIVPQVAGMIAGFGAQKTAEHLSKRSVAELTTLIARGGVPAPIVQNTIQLLAKSKREALSRALMAMGVFAGTHSARAEAPN